MAAEQQQVQSSSQQDPFERLPPELTQLITESLPLSDAWRLRSVDKTWNEQLSEEDAARAIASRWNTHYPEQRASHDAHPNTTPAQDVQRAQSFLSGQPVAVATIPLDDVETSGVSNLQLAGKWLAYRVNHDLGGPMKIVVWDLVARTKRSFTTGPTESPGFVLTTEMICYTCRDPDQKEQMWRDKPLNNAINVVNLTDLSIKVERLQFPMAMQQSIREAADKSCMLILRHQGAGKYWEQVDVYDFANDASYTFEWKAPVDDTMSYTFTIDADKRVVSLWTAYTRYASGPQRGADNMIIKCMVAADRYSFEGEKLDRIEKQIMLEDQDHQEMGIMGPWIMKLSQAGAPDSWSAYIDFWPDDKVETTMQIDWSSSDDKIDAYYRTLKGTTVWKYNAFNLGPRGELYVSRNTTKTSMDAKLVSQCDAHKVADEVEGDELTRALPQLAAVSESFLVVSDRKAITVYSFDELATPLEHESSTAEAEQQALTWRSAAGLFVKAEGPSIAHRRTTPQGRARDASGPDPVLDSLKRVMNMLDEPL